MLCMFKKSVKLFIALSLICILVTPNNSSVYASDKNSSTGKEKVGEVHVFKSIDDELGIPNSGLPNKSDISIQQVAGIIYEYGGWYGSSYLIERATATGDYKFYCSFVKYLTASWAHASAYTWTESNTTSWSISPTATWDIADDVRVSLGLSRTRTTTYEVGITIPADSSRFSKLGFASDYFRQYYYYEKIVDGLVTDSESGNITTPTSDTYLLVYYQS